MQTMIRYAGLCLKGLVRPNNEDNLWYPGGCLQMVHEDLQAFCGTVFPGPDGAFAVFDGMGGESCGEAASHLAAAEFGHWAGRNQGLMRGEEAAVCRAMNRAVLDYAKTNRASGMGSTAVSLCFDEAGVYGFNLGDSRCYRYSERKLYALSTDHAVVSPVTRRSRLTQCLGIPETEFVLEPAVFSAPYEAGDLFLLCSDGLTSMVNPVKLDAVLLAEADITEKLETLREMVFRRGAEDNVTILLFEIREVPDTAGNEAK